MRVSGTPAAAHGPHLTPLPFFQEGRRSGRVVRPSLRMKDVAADAAAAAAKATLPPRRGPRAMLGTSASSRAAAAPAPGRASSRGPPSSGVKDPAPRRRAPLTAAVAAPALAVVLALAVPPHPAGRAEAFDIKDGRYQAGTEGAGNIPPAFPGHDDALTLVRRRNMLSLGVAASGRGDFPPFPPDGSPIDEWRRWCIDSGYARNVGAMTKTVEWIPLPQTRGWYSTSFARDPDMTRVQRVSMSSTLSQKQVRRFPPSARLAGPRAVTSSGGTAGDIVTVPPSVYMPGVASTPEFFASVGIDAVQEVDVNVALSALILALMCISDVSLAIAIANGGRGISPVGDAGAGFAVDLGMPVEKSGASDGSWLKYWRGHFRVCLCLICLAALSAVLELDGGGNSSAGAAERSHTAVPLHPKTGKSPVLTRLSLERYAGVTAVSLASSEMEQGKREPGMLRPLFFFYNADKERGQSAAYRLTVIVDGGSEFFAVEVREMSESPHQPRGTYRLDICATPRLSELLPDTRAATRVAGVQFHRYLMFRPSGDDFAPVCVWTPNHPESVDAAELDRLTFVFAG